MDSSVSDLMPVDSTTSPETAAISVASWRVAPSSTVIAAGSPVITVLLLSLHHYTISTFVPLSQIIVPMLLYIPRQFCDPAHGLCLPQ